MLCIQNGYTDNVLYKTKSVDTSSGDDKLVGKADT